MGGFKGTIFVDHLGAKDSPKQFHKGDKLLARLVTADPATKKFCLSLVPHLLSLKSAGDLMSSEGVTVGKVFEGAEVEKVVYGHSY